MWPSFGTHHFLQKKFTSSLLKLYKPEVKNILNELTTDKSTVVDMMHPKLVKLTANYLARLLS